MDHLHRLERAREVLARRPGLDGSRARLLLASGAGFSPELTAAAASRDDLVLADLERLYLGA
jgi:hypothetical protein